MRSLLAGNQATVPVSNVDNAESKLFDYLGAQLLVFFLICTLNRSIPDQAIGRHVVLRILRNVDLHQISCLVQKRLAFRAKVSQVKSFSDALVLFQPKR